MVLLSRDSSQITADLQGVCLVQADMFSFAVVLWTICTEEVPIRGHLRTLRVRHNSPTS